MRGGGEKESWSELFPLPKVEVFAFSFKKAHRRDYIGTNIILVVKHTKIRKWQIPDCP